MIVIGTQVLTGLQDQETLERVIDAELARAAWYSRCESSFSLKIG
jgi:hypothetical protein